MKLLLLGDSLFARYEGKDTPHINHSLKELVPELEMTNFAESGNNSIDLLQKVRTLDILGVDHVFIWIGANDLATNKQVYLGEFQDNLKQIASKLLEHYTPAQLTFLGVAPIDEKKQLYRTNRLVSYYSDSIEKIAREVGADFISMENLFYQSDYELSDLLQGSMDDGLHFGEKGYRLIARTLVEYLKSR